MQKLIDKFQLVPHPEGGYFSEFYRSEQSVKSATVNQDRRSATHIYFLLPAGQVSLFHNVVHDEIWNFYEGDPLKLLKYDGRGIEEEIIGPAGNGYVSIVKGGVYQAAESTGAYSLVGCTVAPGFEFEDFSFLRDERELKERFLEEYPDYRKFV